MFLANQSAIDVLASFVLLMVEITDPLSGRVNRNADSWRDQLYCRLWVTMYPLWALLMSSTYNIVMVTLERYFAIVHPVMHKVLFNLQAYISIVYG